MSESYLTANEIIVSVIRVDIFECLWIKEDGDFLGFIWRGHKLPIYFPKYQLYIYMHISYAILKWSWTPYTICYNHSHISRVVNCIITSQWRHMHITASDVTCSSEHATSMRLCWEVDIYIYIYIVKNVSYAQLHEFLRWISNNSSIIFCATRGVAFIALNHLGVENRDDIFTESY